MFAPRPLLIGCDNHNSTVCTYTASNPNYVDRLFLRVTHEEAIAKAEEDVLRMEQRYGDNTMKQHAILMRGNLYRECNRLAKQKKPYMRALEIRKTLFGNDHQITAEDAKWYWGIVRIADRIDEAEELYKESLRIRIATLGLKSEHTAVSLNNLGLLLQSKGKA